MKLSFCTTGCKKKHIFDIISFAKEHSFEGIELWYGHAKQYIEEIGARQALSAASGGRHRGACRQFVH